MWSRTVPRKIAVPPAAGSATTASSSSTDNGEVRIWTWMLLMPPSSRIGDPRREDGLLRLRPPGRAAQDEQGDAAMRRARRPRLRGRDRHSTRSGRAARGSAWIPRTAPPDSSSGAGPQARASSSPGAPARPCRPGRRWRRPRRARPRRPSCRACGRARRGGRPPRRAAPGTPRRWSTRATKPDSSSRSADTAQGCITYCRSVAGRRGQVQPVQPLGRAEGQPGRQFHAAQSGDRPRPAPGPSQPGLATLQRPVELVVQGGVGERAGQVLEVAELPARLGVLDHEQPRRLEVPGEDRVHARACDDRAGAARPRVSPGCARGARRPSRSISSRSATSEPSGTARSGASSGSAPGCPAARRRPWRCCAG